MTNSYLFLFHLYLAQAVQILPWQTMTQTPMWMMDRACVPLDLLERTAPHAPLDLLATTVTPARLDLVAKTVN